MRINWAFVMIVLIDSVPTGITRPRQTIGAFEFYPIAVGKRMLPSAVTDIKAFVPAKDIEVSKAFYSDLGFTINFSNDQIAELQIGSFRFLLQKFYVAEHAGNFMMSMSVDDADAWWDYIQQKEFTRKYPGIMCEPPQMQPWGLRILYLSDPSGVLWHIAENRKS